MVLIPESVCRYFYLSTLCTERPTSTNINKEAANIQKIILNSANRAMPHFPLHNNRTFVPWWNKKLEDLKRTRNRLLNIFRKNMTDDNLVNYRKANAIFKRELKISKKLSVDKFTSEIKSSNPTGKVWSNIRRFCGINPKLNIHCISDNNNIKVSDRSEVANIFCKHWSDLSHDNNFPLNFQLHKTDIKKVPCTLFQIKTPQSSKRTYPFWNSQWLFINFKAKPLELMVLHIR